MLTVCSAHCSTDDSLKCFTYPQARELLKLALKGEKVDSLIYFYDARIDLLNEIVEHKDGQLELAQQLISEQSIQIAGLKAKLSESERKRANLKKVLIVFGSAILVEGIIIFVK